MTALTERLKITRAFDISFMASCIPLLRFSTFHIFPYPPFPIA
ncbi:MAG: hypothetical protein P4M11_11615 [Candidatus Pacebacteria bacterium]|nr:hypothetical protein [Candidatus Paceibacterota bacterium]